MSTKNVENKEFYFEQVNITADENPHELMDFELLNPKTLKLDVNCENKNCDVSSICLNKQDKDFPDELYWIAYNCSIKRVTFLVEFIDKNNDVIHKCYIALLPSQNNDIKFLNVSKTEKIRISCIKSSNIGKRATVTIVARN